MRNQLEYGQENQLEWIGVHFGWLLSLQCISTSCVTTKDWGDTANCWVKQVLYFKVNAHKTPRLLTLFVVCYFQSQFHYTLRNTTLTKSTGTDSFSVFRFNFDVVCDTNLWQNQRATTWFPTHRGPYGFRSFSSTKMSFSLQRNVIFYHVDVKNRVLKISKTTSFFDISSCFFGMQHFFPSSQKLFIALTALQSSSRNRWGVNGPKDFRQQ